MVFRHQGSVIADMDVCGWVDKPAVEAGSFNREYLWLSTLEFWRKRRFFFCCRRGGGCFVQVSVWPLWLHLLEGVLCPKLRILDPVSIVVVIRDSSFDVFEYCASPLESSLDPSRENFCTFRQVLCIPLIDYGVADNFQDCVGEVGGFFLPFSLNYQNKSWVVFAEMSKEAPLESHLNCFPRYPTILCGQASDFVKGDLVAASIVDDVSAFWEFDGAGI